MDTARKLLLWLVQTYIKEMVWKWVVFLSATVGAVMMDWLESFPWGFIGNFFLLAFTFFVCLVAYDQLGRLYRTWRSGQPHGAIQTDLTLPEPKSTPRKPAVSVIGADVAAAQQKAKERRDHLWRRWEDDPKNGRKAARLMLEIDLKEAKEIYRDFAPWDDDPNMLKDDTKLYRWAVSYAWVCRLALAGECSLVKGILEEADFSTAYWDNSAGCQDSKIDKQTFFTDPGGQKAFDDWIEKR